MAIDNPTPAVFDTIREVAETAIRHADETLNDEGRRKLGAVNWGDIGAGDVVHCRDRDGRTWFTVEIGEASPGCALAELVRCELSKAFPSETFEVRADW